MSCEVEVIIMFCTPHPPPTHVMCLESCGLVSVTMNEVEKGRLVKLGFLLLMD